MEEHNVASDSTFFIAFLSKDEINDVSLLLKIVQHYKFYIGHVIKEELSQYENVLKSSGIIDNLVIVNLKDKYDYAALLSIFGYKIMSKGEYEAIAIAYELYRYVRLHSLILDDKRARKFVSYNFPELSVYVKYSLRFVVDLYCVDNSLSKEEVKSFLKRVENAIRREARPFNLTSLNLYIIEELIAEVNRCHR